MSRKLPAKLKPSVIIPDIIRNAIEEGFELAHKYHRDPSEKIIKAQLEETLTEYLNKYVDFE